MSCMNGDIPVQFLGEEVTATSPPYPTPRWETAPAYPTSPAVVTGEVEVNGGGRGH